MIRFLRKFGGFIVAGAVLVGGLAYSLVPFLDHNAIQERIRLNDSGTTEVRLHPGKYAVYYEYETSRKSFGFVEISESDRNAAVPGVVELSIVDEKNRSIEAHRDTSLTYSVNRRSGESMFGFRVQDAGTYTVRTQLPEELRGAVRLVLAENFTRALLTLLGQIGLAFLVSALIAVVSIFIYLSQSRKLRHAEWR